MSCEKSPIDKARPSISRIIKSVLLDGDWRAKQFDKGLDKVHTLFESVPGLDWFTVSKEARAVHEFTRGFNEDVAKATMDAAEIAKWLKSELSKDDSITLTRVLAGDLDKADLPEHLKATYKMFRGKLDDNTRLLVKYGALDEKNVMDDYLKRYYSKYLNDTTGLKERLTSKFGGKLGEYFKRKDLSHEQRIELGLIEDADFVISNTLLEQRKQILKAKLLKQMADELSIPEPKNGFKEGYERVSDATAGGGIKRYGALAGRYVPKKVYTALTDMQVVREISTPALILNKWIGVVDHIKVNVTVKNPGTHVYNVTSNLQLAYLKGDIRALSEVIRMAATDQKKFKKLVKLARELGLNSELDDFMDLVKDFTPESAKKSSRSHLVWSVFKNLYMSEDSMAGKAMRKTYAMEDEIFKLANFYKQIKGRKMGRASAKKAMREAMADYVDYQTPLPTFIRWIDKLGVMPFTHYVWKSTPRVARIIVKHPYRYALLQIALLESGASMFNDDDYLSKPGWASDKLNLFNAKQWIHIGSDRWLNLGRSLPGVRWGKLEFDGGFVGGIAMIMMGKDPLWGSDFVSKFDSNAQHWSKVAQKLAQYYAPAITFGRYAQRGIRKATNFHPPKDAYGEELSWNEMLLRPLGVRKFNSKKELNKHLHDVVKQWSGGYINTQERDDEIAMIKEYAKKNKIQIKEKSFNRYLKKVEKEGPKPLTGYVLPN